MAPTMSIMSSCCSKTSSMMLRDTFRLVPARCIFLDSATVPAEQHGTVDRAKPFEEIPGPKPLPLVGNLFRYLPLVGEYSAKTYHESQMKKFRKYGKIVREEIFPGYNMVHLFDPKDIATLFRNESKRPRRDFFVGIGKARQSQPDKFKTIGLAPGNGDVWYNLRSPAQKALMHPQFIQQYYPKVNVVADSMVNRIKRIRNDENKIPGLLDEIFKWALDSVMYVIFSKTKGCMDHGISESPEVREYIKAVNNFFKYSGQVEMSMVPIWRIAPWLSPSYLKLVAAHQKGFDDAKMITIEALQEMQNQKIDDKDEVRPIIERWLKECSVDDAIFIAIDTMGAAIDTTSISVANFLRNIAANPEAQNKLHEEVDRVLPFGEAVTADKVEKMPYLRACLKESLRLSPTAGGTFRTLEKDLVLGDHHVPKGTFVSINLHITSLLEENFLEADKFIPERWLKKCPSKYSATDSFACQPFSFGPRMCVGKRLAEMEMHTLLAKLMQNFRVENKHHDVDIRYQLVLMIQNPLMIEFHDRR